MFLYKLWDVKGSQNNKNVTLLYNRNSATKRLCMSSTQNEQKKCNIILCLRKIQSVESEEKLHKNEITLCMLPFWCSQSKISDFMLSWLYMYMHNF